MADLDTFRSETRSWLQQNCPPSLVGLSISEIDGTWGGKKWQFANPDMKTWLDLMSAKGWTAPTWHPSLLERT